MKILDEVRIKKIREEKGKSNEFGIIKKKIWNIVDNSFDIGSSLIAKVFKGIFCICLSKKRLFRIRIWSLQSFKLLKKIRKKLSG